MIQTVLMGDGFTIVDGRLTAGVTLDGLSSVLGRLDSHIGRDATVILQHSAYVALGERDEDWPDGGWRTHQLSGKRTLHLVALDRLTPGRVPLMQREFMDVEAALRIWRTSLGAPFLMTPGVAGLELLRAIHPAGGHRTVHWTASQTGPADAYEPVWSPGDWRRDLDPGCTYVHGYDSRRAGLAAMNVAMVPRGPLRHHNRLSFDPRMAGWWRIELAPGMPYSDGQSVWQLDHQLPDPAGYHYGLPLTRWVTTPTLQLIQWCCDQGIHPGYRIHEAYLAPGVRLFREWAERLDRFYRDGIAGRLDFDPNLSEALAATAKETFRETHGMFNSDSSCPRPDWYHTINAMKRATAWRAGYSVGTATGRWPVWIDDDCLYYGSTHDAADRDVPEPLKLGIELGRWDAKRVIEVTATSTV